MTRKSLPLAVVDYGLGNIFSLTRALRRVGADAAVTSDPDEVLSAERLILPGVGAFGDGMLGLHERGLIGALRRYAESGRPLLGICLGLQLFMDEGSEFGRHEGLGLIPGKAAALKPAAAAKIPHVGWNAARPSAGAAWSGTPFSDAAPDSQFYFVHSFVAEPANPADRLAETSYGGTTFCASARRGGVLGVQFHPEKSGPAGLRLLARFAGVKTPGAMS